MALSFATDIRPLFRDDPDVETMKAFGMDLSSYEDVMTHVSPAQSFATWNARVVDAPAVGARAPNTMTAATSTRIRPIERI